MAEQMLKSCQCLICPLCGAHELKNCGEPDVDKWLFQIRAFRVDNFSECLACKSWF
jgi:hypothetical protein